VNRKKKVIKRLKVIRPKAARRTKVDETSVDETPMEKGHFLRWLEQEQDAGRIGRCGCPEKFKGIDCPACHGTGIARIHEAWPLIVEYVTTMTRPVTISDVMLQIM
jgi:hypothetical protein